jgi:hypothetical protein
MMRFIVLSVDRPRATIVEEAAAVGVGCEGSGQLRKQG